MGEVFLSYKAEDRARLKPLVAALEADGCQMWWDAHIGGGTDWREEIQDHLDGAHCVIVAWSERSVGPDGRFVRDEATRALRRGAYLAISIDGVAPPLGFGELQAIPLGGWKGNRKDPRYQALLTAVRARLAGETPPPIPANLATPRISRRAAIAGGVGTAAIAATGGWFLLKPTAANAKRIAVLPFASLSADKEQAYFSEGIAEELRSALSRIGLEVIGRASSDAVKGMDTKKAASSLGVANILSGTVRRSAETIRINAQLVSGKDGVERWAQSYDRAPGDAIKIQTDIATNVAQALSIALGQAGRAALTLGGTADSAAQDLYLRATDLFLTTSDADSYRKTIDLLDAALARDSNYADAYRLKAGALEILGANFAKDPGDIAAKLAQAETAARRALAIAPKLGWAHTTLGFIEADRFNFASALRHNERALELSPNNPGVLVSASAFTQYFGDAHEALRLTDRAIALDPLRSASYLRRAQVLQTLRQYPQSIAAARKALSLAPQLSAAHAFIGNALTLMGRYTEAKAEYKLVPADDFQRLLGEGFVAARTGDKAGAQRVIAQLRQQYGAAASYQYAQVYAQLGDKDRAVAEFDNAIAAKDPGLQTLKSDPFLDPIRGDPRYAALLKRLKFP
jgi:serine/threonine-protein kinase